MVGGQGKLVSSGKGLFMVVDGERKKKFYQVKNGGRFPAGSLEAFGHQIDINMVFSEETRLRDPNWQGLN